MSYEGKKYKCITETIPFLYKDEVVEVIVFDVILDSVKLKRDRDSTDLFISTDKFYNGFISYEKPIECPVVVEYLGPKCDCGISKTFGRDAKGFMHYTDCPSYINDKYIV